MAKTTPAETREDYLASLKAVGEQCHQRFGPPGPNHSGRLQQLDSALATAAMAVGHLFDEDVRHTHLHERIEREPALATIHGHQDAWAEE